MGNGQGGEATFWEHFDVLRKSLFRIIIAVVAVMVVVFTQKQLLFDIVLAPYRSDFVLYRALCRLGEALSMPALCPEPFHVDLISTQLPAQFLAHMSMSFYMALLITFPYIVYEIFRFISPALRQNEKKYSVRILVWTSLFFFMGVALNYFLIFPLSFRFLATYQVNEAVVNTITLSSYTGTLMMLSLMMGIMAELPVVTWMLSKFGLLSSSFMRKYRRHAIVLLLFIAAVITPTTDIFTLLLVFTPVYLLYEASIVIVAKSERKKTAMATSEEPA